MKPMQAQVIEQNANALGVSIHEADRHLGRGLLYLLALHGAGDDMESVADWLAARAYAVLPKEKAM